MTNHVKIGILGGLVALILLSGYYYIQLNQSPDLGTPSAAPTGAAANVSPRPSVAPRTETDIQLEQVLKRQLPILQDDVEITYSPLTRQFYIYKKTAQADQILAAFITKNKISDAIVRTRFTYVNKPALEVLLSEEQRLFPSHPDTQEIDQAHDTQ